MFDLYPLLPTSFLALIQRIEDARWRSVEDERIALAEARSAVGNLDVDAVDAKRANAILDLLLLLQHARRQPGSHTSHESIIAALPFDVKDDPLLNAIAWRISVNNSPTRETVIEADRLARILLESGWGPVAVLFIEHTLQHAQEHLTSDEPVIIWDHWSPQLERLNLPLALRGRVLGLLAQVATQFDDPTFVAEIDRLTELSRSWHWVHASFLHLQAWIAFKSGRLQSAGDTIDAMLAEVDTHGDPYLRSQAYRSAAWLYRAMDDRLSVAQFANKALIYATDAGDWHSAHQIANMLAWFYDSIGMIDQALEFARRACDVAMTTMNPDAIFTELLILGKIQSRVGDIGSALATFDQAITFSGDVKSQRLPHAHVLIFKGHALTRAHRPKEALAVLYEALGEIEAAMKELPAMSNNDSLGVDNVRWGLALAHHQVAEYDKALEFYLQVVESGRLQLSEESISIFRFIAECYRNLGEPDKALDAYERFLEAQDKHQDSTQRNNLIRQQIDQRVAEERKRTERERQLLHAILPASIAERRIEGERRIADTIDDVVVLFIDVAGFTPKAQLLSAHQLVDYLEQLFDPIEAIVAKHGGEKIKTIGDAFMAACGATSEMDRRAERMVRAALEIADLHGSDIRIGINSGQVVAGVLGEGRFTFDLWGDAVNTAARMEEYGEPGRVHVTAEIARQIDGINDLRIESRGIIDVKGKGLMQTYWVTRA